MPHFVFLCVDRPFIFIAEVQGNDHPLLPNQIVHVRSRLLFETDKGWGDGGKCHQNTNSKVYISPQQKTIFRENCVSPRHIPNILFLMKPNYMAFSPYFMSLHNSTKK